MRRILTLAPALAVLTLVGLLGLTVPPANAAVSCYGDYCSGKNPYTTTGPGGRLCSSGAYSVAFKNAPYDPNLRVDVMWSPHCQTNWAQVRWQPTNLQIKQETGYNPGGYYYQGGIWNTAMVYSPKLRVSATACHAYAGCMSTAWV